MTDMMGRESWKRGLTMTGNGSRSHNLAILEEIGYDHKVLQTFFCQFSA